MQNRVKISEKIRMGAEIIAFLSKLKVSLLLFRVLNLNTVVISNVKERIGYIWEATDKPLIKIGKFKKYLHIYLVL